VGVDERTALSGRPTRNECAGPLRTRPNMPMPTFIRDWISEMSQYFKANDPVHLVGVGDEGFVALDGPSTGWDAARSGYYGINWYDILAMNTIDVGTTYYYPDLNSPTQSMDGVKWINWHGDIARQYGKPVILEEYFSEKLDNQFNLMKPWLQAVEQNAGRRARIPRGFGVDDTRNSDIYQHQRLSSDVYFVPLLQGHNAYNHEIQCFLIHCF
jgi:endo-1,4-beta-mannosidase